jgi:hypothetical protein
MIINYLALLSALAVSAVSGYYSIVGLTAIFSSQFWPIVIMGSVLEIGKLVSASWLYRNWNDTSILIKSYLTCAVILLMFITSMGIFGFLSRAHIEQSINMTTGNADRIKIIENQINFENKSIEDLNIQTYQIDAAIAKMTDRGQAATSLKAADQQRKTRDNLVKRKNDHVKNISTLTAEKIKLDSEVKKLEAEVGPLKYIAELIYDKTDVDQVERAVRIVIILLVIVFDPLAIILLIAANQGFANAKPKGPFKKNVLTKNPKALKINSDTIFK